MIKNLLIIFLIFFLTNSLSEERINTTEIINLDELKPTFEDAECVMEVKAPIDCDDDYIKGLIPHSTSRFSKYSRGLFHADGMM